MSENFRSSPSGSEVVLTVAATGSDVGYASFETTSNASSSSSVTVEFNTPADIPAGNRFTLIFDGGGGGGAGGTATSGADTNPSGGGGAGAGGARRVLELTRSQFIALLPVKVIVPRQAQGGAGGVTTGARTIGQPGEQGGTVLFQSRGLTLFSTYGGGGGSLENAGSGGFGGGGGGYDSAGANAAAISGNGGLPLPGEVDGSPVDSIYGGGGGAFLGGSPFLAQLGRSVWGGTGGARGAFTTINLGGGPGGMSDIGGSSGGGGGGADGNTTSPAATSGGTGGGPPFSRAAGGTGRSNTITPAGNGAAGLPGNELQAGLGGGGGAAHCSNGASATGGNGGDGGDGGGGGGGGGGAVADTGTATGGAGGKGGKAKFTLIGLL